MGAPPKNTIPVRLEAEQGDVVGIVQPGLRLPLPQRLDEVGAYLGKQVILGIRPECFDLGEVSPADGARLSARVEMLEPTGAETMAVLNLAGTEVIARMGANARPPIGQIAPFLVDMSKACLFDVTTEQRFG